MQGQAVIVLLTHEEDCGYIRLDGWHIVQNNLPSVRGAKHDAQDAPKDKQREHRGQSPSRICCVHDLVKDVEFLCGVAARKGGLPSPSLLLVGLKGEVSTQVYVAIGISYFCQCIQRLMP